MVSIHRTTFQYRLSLEQIIPEYLRICNSGEIVTYLQIIFEVCIWIHSLVNHSSQVKVGLTIELAAT